MRCPICRKDGHLATNCPALPEDIAKQDFTEEERRTARENQARVEEKFIDKLKRVISKVPFAIDAAAMYYVMLDPKTEFWVKATVAGALAYFISPVDIIPDVIPIAGHADDATVIYTTLRVIHGHIKDEHIAQAKALLNVA